MSRPKRDLADLSDESRLYAEDQVPGFTGGSRPATPRPTHPATIALALGLLVISALSALGIITVIVAQIYKAVSR